MNIEKRLMIYILTGNIRTGKTTALFEWLTIREDVDGILCPDDESGKRFFLKIKNHETFPLEVNANSSEAIVSVGNFKFLKSSFQVANDYLIYCLKENRTKYFIIDELGKLELQNEGLHKAAAKLIKSHEFSESTYLILVVRSSLLDEIIEKYQIMNYKLIDTADLLNLK